VIPVNILLSTTVEKLGVTGAFLAKNTVYARSAAFIAITVQ
jgi:hypothetical protein